MKRFAPVIVSFLIWVMLTPTNFLTAWLAFSMPAPFGFCFFLLTAISGFGWLFALFFWVVKGAEALEAWSKS